MKSTPPMSQDQKLAVWGRLDLLLSETGPANLHIKLDTCSESCWGCELIYVPRPHNPDGPDQGVTFYTGGGDGPEDVLKEALDAFDAWQQRRPQP